jgi:hypothetical protein
MSGVCARVPHLGEISAVGGLMSGISGAGVQNCDISTR